VKRMHNFGWKTWGDGRAWGNYV